MRALLAGDWRVTGGVLNITAAACTAGFHWWRSGNITRTQNVSEYILVLALCLVCLSNEEPKSNTTKTNNTGTRWHTNRKSKNISKENLNQQSTLRTAHMCVRITVHNCRKLHNTAQNSSDDLLFYPLVNHHCLNVVCWRGEE